MKSLKLLPVLLISLLSVFSLPALAVGITEQKSIVADISSLPRIAFEKYTLSNGLDVILVEDHRLPMTTVNLWYHVGAANEEPGLTGFAHLFEHMMFAASKHVPRGMADKLLESAGVTDSNGSTDFDRTNYFDTVPSNQLELALWIHSDRMGYLLDVLDQDALSNQQDVVRNERRQHIENRPYGIVEEAIFHQLFPKTHPYYASVMGSHEDIQAAKLEDIRRFFKRYYRPNNASIVIAGDIDKAKTKLLVEKYFGHFKRGEPIPKLQIVTPPITQERRVEVQDQVELPRVFMGWLTPAAFKAGDAELGVAAQILAGGKSSRLYKKLVYDMQIAQDVNASQNSNALTSIFIIDATARPGHSAKELEAAINEELNQLRSTPPSEVELERVMNSFETASFSQMEKIGGFGLANMLNEYNHYLGDPGYLEKDILRYRQVTAEDVQRVSAAQLQNNARVVVYGIPGTKVLGAEVPTPLPPKKIASTKVVQGLHADQSWRKHIPKAGPLRSVVLPKGESFQLPNGLTVIYHYNPALPLVSVELVFKSGSAANPVDSPGLASFTAQMLDEGTLSRSSMQIADQVAQLGASLSAGASIDASSAQVMSLKKNIDQAVDLLADVVLNPSFPLDEIERQRSSRLAELRQQRENAPAIASRVAAAALFGDKHAYGYLELGTESANKATQRDDLIAFWKKNYVPRNAALVVSGAMTGDEVKAMAQAKFGQWQGAASPIASLGKPETTAARLVLVDQPDAPQTALQLEAIGVERKSLDYAALQVLNGAFGGLFTSRLNTNLREQKGYTYGVGSGFQFQRVSGTFTISGSIRTDVTVPALKEIFKEIKAISAKPMLTQELEKARNAQILSLPARFETNSGMSASMANIFAYDLGLDYYNGLANRFAAVTAKDTQTVAKKYLKPESMIVVGVGDKNKIQQQLKRLNMKLGQVEYRDADGNILK